MESAQSSRLVVRVLTKRSSGLGVQSYREAMENEPQVYHPVHMVVIRKGNVLFNDALNTFSSRLYGVRHMVKDHSDSEKGNPLLPHRLLFPISSKGSFICTIPQTG